MEPEELSTRARHWSLPEVSRIQSTPFESVPLKPILLIIHSLHRAMAQAVSSLPLSAEAWVRTLVGPYMICGEQSGTLLGFPLSVSFHWASILI
jgi:hypothetical protein